MYFLDFLLVRVWQNVKERAGGPVQVARREYFVPRDVRYLGKFEKELSLGPFASRCLLIWTGVLEPTCIAWYL